MKISKTALEIKKIMKFSTEVYTEILNAHL